MKSIAEDAKAVSEDLGSGENEALARAFSRFGWLGVWSQVTIGAIPVVLTIYAFLFDRNVAAGTRGGLALIEYLTILDLLVLAFTTLWSYRYTRLATQIADPQRRPSLSAMQRAAWTGVTASTVGILLSVLIMLLEAAQLFVYFLRAPQAGIPVIQTTGGGAASWVSAADIMNLLALILSLLIEVVVLAFSLRLLFRSTPTSPHLLRSSAKNGAVSPPRPAQVASAFEGDTPPDYGAQAPQAFRHL